ncbi:MAG: hypothetical protein U1E36_09180 [Rickettsiales bacterium]
MTQKEKRAFAEQLLLSAALDGQSLSADFIALIESLANETIDPETYKARVLAHADSKGGA